MYLKNTVLWQRAVLFQQLPVDGVFHVVHLQAFVTPGDYLFLELLLQAYDLKASPDVDVLPHPFVYHADDLTPQGIAVHVAQDAQITVDALDAFLDVINGLSLVELID